MRILSISGSSVSPDHQLCLEVVGCLNNTGELINRLRNTNISAAQGGEEALNLLDKIFGQLTPPNESFIDLTDLKADLNKVQELVNKKIRVLIKAGEDKISKLAQSVTQHFQQASETISKIIKLMQTQFDFKLSLTPDLLTSQDQGAIYKSLEADLSSLVKIAAGYKLRALCVYLNENMQLASSTRIERSSETADTDILEKLREALGRYIGNNKSLFEALIKSRNGQPIFFAV